MNKSKLVTLSSAVIQCEGNIVSDMDGETVMVSIRNGKYYNLGEVGGMIWGLIKAEKTVESVIENIIKEYNVERDVCEKQVVEFLVVMVEENLISVVT